MADQDKPATSANFTAPLGAPDPNKPAEKPAAAASPPAPKPGPAVAHAPDPTAKVIDDPADANQGDVNTALAVDPYRAPAPFSKRDGLPDITSESVNVRLLKDYWPEDTARFGNQMRGREGQVLAFPSDEALELIRSGIGEREEDAKLKAEQHRTDDAKMEPPR